MAEEWKIQHSVKFHNGDLLNVRAESVDELHDMFAELGDGKGLVIMGIADTLRAESAVTTEFPTSSPGGADASQGASNASGSDKRCAHNRPMEWRSKVNKQGKPYKGWFCVSKGVGGNNTECEPIFVRD